MNRKNLIAAALAAGSLMGMASVAQAVPAVVAGTVPYTEANPAPYGYMSPPAYTTMAPPPAPIYESVPAPRSGYIWAPGHYVWNNGRYEWRGGEWMASRPGYGWQAAQWQQRGDGSWYLAGGHWVQTDNYAGYNNGGRGYRDHDGDGVINRNDHDRDGDGVLNRDDPYPNDGRRW